MYTACATIICATRLNQSQIGYQAELNQSQEPSLSSQVPIYPWVERSNYSEVSCSGTQVSRPGLEPTLC